MPVHDELGKRMKGYEQVSKTSLVKRMPVAIRLDGRAFHTFSKGFQKPFDNILMRTMQETMKYLCENIQGCVFGYTQSDEITLILIDYQSLETQPWFDNEVQKICSISSSMCTMKFNQLFSLYVDEFYNYIFTHKENEYLDIKNVDEYIIKLQNSRDKGAMFDSRCFNIPKEEVCNLIYWRQVDAIRNSIQMVGQANFSQSELQYKSCEDIKAMLLDKKMIDWENDYYPYQQRGLSCIRINGKWYIDTGMPILKGEDRNYLERFIFLDD